MVSHFVLKECIYGVAKELRLETVKIVFFDSSRRHVVLVFVFHSDLNAAYCSEFTASRLFSPTVLAGARKRESKQSNPVTGLEWPQRVPGS